jgi:hypothetical protein
VHVAGAIAVGTLVMRCASFGTVSPSLATPALASLGSQEPTTGSFCANHDASSCADFDEDPDATAAWTSLATSGAGVVSETTTTFV